MKKSIEFKENGKILVFGTFKDQYHDCTVTYHGVEIDEYYFADKHHIDLNKLADDKHRILKKLTARDKKSTTPLLTTDLWKSYTFHISRLDWRSSISRGKNYEYIADVLTLDEIAPYVPPEILATLNPSPEISRPDLAAHTEIEKNKEERS